VAQYHVHDSIKNLSLSRFFDVAIDELKSRNMSANVWVRVVIAGADMVRPVGIQKKPLESLILREDTVETDVISAIVCDQRHNWKHHRSSNIFAKGKVQGDILEAPLFHRLKKFRAQPSQVKGTHATFDVNAIFAPPNFAGGHINTSK